MLEPFMWQTFNCMTPSLKALFKIMFADVTGESTTGVDGIAGACVKEAGIAGTFVWLSLV